MQLGLWGYSLSELAAGKIQRQYWKWLFGMRYSSLINCIVNRLQHFATSWWLMCNDKCWMHWSTWLGFVNGLDHFLLYAYLLFISNSSVQAHLQKVVDGGCSAVPAVWCIHGINQNNGCSPHGLHSLILSCLNYSTGFYNMPWPWKYMSKNQLYYSLSKNNWLFFHGNSYVWNNGHQHHGCHIVIDHENMGLDTHHKRSKDSRSMGNFHIWNKVSHHHGCHRVIMDYSTQL